MTTPHTCTNCNCPKCLIQRAGLNNPAVQQALAEAWTPEHQAWGLPAAEEYQTSYPVAYYQDQVPQQRAYNDPVNPLNYGVDRYPQRAKAPILGLIPRRLPASPIEWFIVGLAGTIVLSTIGTVIWIVWSIIQALENFGEFVTTHATQIFSALLAIVIVVVLVMLCSGGGRGFSGEFHGRMH